MRIAPHQVSAFFDAYFSGRDAELRAIDSLLGMQKLAIEQRDALQFAGFTNGMDERIVLACYQWAASKSPYVAGFDAPEARPS